MRIDIDSRTMFNLIITKGLIMKFLFSLLFLIQIHAFANTSTSGWVSGGGELIEDAKNPWFLINTKQVKYCIQIDEANFGQNISSVRQRIEKAFNFWKVQFNTNSFSQNESLATQVFTEVSCNESPDLQFQFGILNGLQLQRIRTPMNYIGLTVRTEYDKVNLKGKGFIYISPQKGTLKFNLLNLENIRENWLPWSEDNGSLLLPTLIHEIGHIFGVPHDDDIYLMGERKLESIFHYIGEKSNANRPNINDWIEIEKTNRFLDFRLFNFGGVLHSEPIKCLNATQLANTEQKDLLQKFFRLKPGRNCILKALSKNLFILTSYDGDKLETIGRAQLTPTSVFKTKSIIKVWLTKEQKVFQGSSAEYLRDLFYMETGRSFKGDFKFKDGSPSKPIYITASTPYFESKISGEVDGHWYLDLEAED